MSMDAPRHKQRSTRILLAVLIGVWAMHAQGQGTRADKCSVGTTLQMKECTGELYRAAEARLQTAIETLKARIRTRVLSGRADWLLQDLAETQKRWVDFRNAECEFQRAINGPGTLEGIAYVSCMHALTDARARKVEVSATTWGVD
jgi:uncharacterized protein YecT (DUF1311 family)